MSAELNTQLNQVYDRVEAGMDWLDANVPDWFLDVNAHALDINDGNFCVLGQLARSDQLAEWVQAWAEDNYLVGASGYVLMAGLFNMGWEEPVRLGFVGSDMLTGEEYLSYIQVLEARWFTAIIFRQKARLLPGMDRSELVKHGPEAA